MQDRTFSNLTSRVLWALLNVGWFGRLLALLSFNHLVVRLLLGRGVLEAAGSWVVEGALGFRLLGSPLIDADMAGRILIIRNVSFGDMVVSMLEGRFFWIDNLMALGIVLALAFATLVAASLFQIYWNPTVLNIGASTICFLILLSSCAYMHVLNAAARRETPADPFDGAEPWPEGAAAWPEPDGGTPPGPGSGNIHDGEKKP